MTEAKPFGRVLLCVTEDWFALSHFVPLMRALREVSREVVVASRDSGRAHKFAALGVTHQAFDFARRSRDPRELVGTVRRLQALIDTVQPDGVHLVAVQTMLLGALAMARRRHVAVVGHVTGLGALGGTDTVGQKVFGRAGLALLGHLTRTHPRHLFVENPEDRALVASRTGISPGDITELGGAGVDPVHYDAMPEPVPLRIGYSGRLVHQKGVHVLIEAMRVLRRRGIDVPLDLYAKLDPVTRAAYTQDDIARWQHDRLATWHGHVGDIRTAWRQAGICVAPSLSREGLPRAVLEAASCGRPLVVTDVAGSRHFVRDGVEGMIVPPGDPLALADALQSLIADPALRQRMGQAARQRILDGFTEHHVERAVVSAYTVLARGR